MSRDKQIEEMAEILWEYSRTRDDDAIALGESLAEYLIDNGYLKTSEVASEVIDDISNFLESRNGVGYVAIGIVELKRRLYELKKKYTEASE